MRCGTVDCDLAGGGRLVSTSEWAGGAKMAEDICPYILHINGRCPGRNYSLGRRPRPAIADTARETTAITKISPDFCPYVLRDFLI